MFEREFTRRGRQKRYSFPELKEGLVSCHGYRRNRRRVGHEIFLPMCRNQESRRGPDKWCEQPYRPPNPISPSPSDARHVPDRANSFWLWRVRGLTLKTLKCRRPAANSLVSFWRSLLFQDAQDRSDLGQ